MGQRKGKIVVEFATVDDLERIVKAMTPAEQAAPRPPTPPRIAPRWIHVKHCRSKRRP